MSDLYAGGFPCMQADSRQADLSQLTWGLGSPPRDARINLRLAYFSQPARMTSSGRSSSTSISVPSGMQLSSKGRV